MPKCKEATCGREIVWGIDENGKRVPLDPVPPVYELLRFDPVEQAYAVERDGGIRPKHYVSHFATCTAPGRFSRKKEQDRPAPPDHKASAAGD